jgi:beta-lactamase regulating signal transducer with metallopeptidase domain
MTHLDFAMTTLLNGIWQGGILAVAMSFLLKLLPRLNPTTRFTILWLTLVAVAALPIRPVMRGISVTGLSTEPVVVTPTNTLAPTAFPSSETRNTELKAASAKKPVESVSQLSPKSGRGPEWARQVWDAASAISLTAAAAVKLSPIRIRSGRVLHAFEMVWALLCLAMLVRLGAGYQELRRLKSGATPAPEEMQLWLRGLCARNGVHRQVRLLVSTHIPAPISLGFLTPAVLIPQELLDVLSDSELEHIVLHELSHLKRRDDWTNLAQKFIEAVLPIQPAIYWIGRRMVLEREMACDDWVIAATGTARRYASSLVKVAELSRWEDAGILAAGAGGNRSQLLRRVHHALYRTRNSTPKLAIGPLGVAVITILALLYVSARTPQMIALAQTPADENSRESATAQVLVPPLRQPIMPSAPVAPLAAQPPRANAPTPQEQNGETHTEMVNRNGWNSLTLKVNGTIEFTDDDRDIKTLSPNGDFRLEEGRWFSSRAYEVKADSAGNLTRTYTVGWNKKPLDDEARAWLGRVLPQIIRDSGIGAGPRIARILRQGGPQAVITEIGLIHSDGSRRVYLELLFSQTTLNPSQLKDAAKLIRGISSDGDKAHVIMTVGTKYFTDELRPYIFEATQSISSDGDKRRVLSDFVSKDGGSGDTLVSVAKAAKHISSDGDKAEVLIEVADSYRATEELRAAYFQAVNSISSDGDHARVLLKLLGKNGDDSETLVRLLRSAEKISSDGDKARVLEEAASHYRDEEPVRKAFFDAANSISSDGDHQQVLVTLVHRPGIGTATLGGIANSAQRISSDGDKAHVLVELAGGDIEPVRDAFFAAADSIHSDGDHSRVLIVLLDRPGTSSVMVIGAIQSATGISSDGDKGRVLMDAADRYSKDPSVNAALRKAIESLHSDGQYRAVMSEITRRAGSI